MSPSVSRLILVRHGNTFGPQDKVVTVGRNQDLHLVESGVIQARAIGEALGQIDPRPRALICGPLLRARETASVIGTQLQLEVQVDPRLDELDYGGWAGLSDPEIAARFEEGALRSWRDHGVWPQSSGWSENEQAVLTRVQALAQDAVAAPGTTVAVSSNGVLRFFLKLVPGLFEQRAAAAQLKMGTGHLGIFEYSGGNFRLLAWNLGPAELGVWPIKGV